MKLRRLAHGDHLSYCGRVRIREAARHCWRVWVDGNFFGETNNFPDARTAARRELDRRDGIPEAKRG